MPDIVALVQRGIMRAVGLEAMLVRRAQRGQDLVILAALTRATRKAPPAILLPKAESPDPTLTLGGIPTAQEIAAEVRRHPIGRTIAAICLDLGISPTLCAGPF